MEEIISALGFPVACVIGLAIWVDKQIKNNREDINRTMDMLREDAKEDKAKLVEEITYNREISAKVLASNEMLVKDVMVLVKDLTVKVDKILEKVGV